MDVCLLFGCAVHTNYFGLVRRPDIALYDTSVINIFYHKLSCRYDGNP